MQYPIIVEYEEEVFLIQEESSITKKIEPFDIVSGCCRFWDSGGFALRPRVQGCFSRPVLGFLTSCFQVVEQKGAVVSFEYCNEALPDREGLQHLLDNNLLMDHATRNVIMNIVAQSGSEEARDELVRDVISVDQLHEIKS